MRTWTIAVACALLLSSCSPTGSGEGITAQPTISSSPSVSSVAPTTTPVPEEQFPISYPITNSLISGDAADVVARLHEVAGNQPALKVDLTSKQATLTALLPDDRVASYRWENGEITEVDSDIQYLGQATFDPAEYPLASLGRMFDIADLRGVRGELVLQIVEYRAGQIIMTVTSRPESRTVFFRKDGTAVASLGLTSVADLTEGIGDVVGDSTEAYSVTVSPTAGYSADLPDDEQGVVLNRTRPTDMPTFETRRSGLPSGGTFDPALIKPEALAKAIARTQNTPSEQCSVTIDMTQNRSAPVARIQCGSSTSYADMDGRDMTDLIG
ncbi:hypothetical protein SAMN02745244_03150 [Tessaracoccus bendigoensis DSM 12906]|uniref:Uncharacterized protein n=1 Tax=Tessaracoccus bendigoensis DSM 12906 TaxID=1123357 RepID=A0A1M6LR32_9ACTN|nr:hypothetical protein [Tessaracoccus bendigoensis]SHJ73688.1 hypothetical protein SAMN02745244_03150 [Tessaracoccus bendigoensis DSM 12906]